MRDLNTEHNLSLLNDVIQAKIHYWNTMLAFERATTIEGFSDKSNDDIHNAVNCLAAALDEDAAVTMADLAMVTALVEEL